MKPLPLMTLLALTSATAQIDPIVYEYPQNLTPYTRFCLAAEFPYPHEMKTTEVQWLRTTIQQAVKASRLPILPEHHADCMPMRIKASPNTVMLFVEVAPSARPSTPWQLLLRVTDPHLLGANGNVYHPVLWELRQTIGPNREHIARSIRASFTWLDRAWKASRTKQPAK